MASSKQPMRTVALILPVTMAKQLAQVAEMEDRSVSSVARRAIDEYLSKREGVIVLGREQQG